jgi:hypothetical protein
MSPTVQRWLHLEDDVLGIAGHRDRLVRRGSGPGAVVITAPHAVPHERDGVLKRADMWTGGLALLVAELTGAAAVVETSGTGDPSWQHEHPFKDAVAALEPAIVLDLHAMRAVDQVVEVGSGAAAHEPASDLAVDVRGALESSGVPTLLDQRFPARGTATLVQWASGRGIAAVQLEVSVRLVPPFAEDSDVERLVHALVAVVGACRTFRPA